MPIPVATGQALTDLDEVLDDVTEQLNVKNDILDAEASIRSLDSNGVGSDEDKPEPDAEVELYQRR